MRYLTRRLGFFVLTLWAAMTLNFFIPRMMPGSPEQALRERFSKGGSVVTPEQLRTVLAEFGFDPGKNLLLQYVEYLKSMVSGHWGVSIGSSLGVPVTTLIGDHKFLGLVNNRHPIISKSVLGAAHRLMLHGLAVELLHAYLVKRKRQQAAANASVAAIC